MIKKIDHVVITTRDFLRCEKFYSAIGFESKTLGNRMELFCGDFKINVHMFKNELTPHATNICVGSADLCFEIDCDIDGLKENLQKKGIQILLGVVERNGVKGKMRSIYVNDPDGNLLEFCKY